MDENGLEAQIVRSKSLLGDSIDVIKLANSLGVEVYSVQEFNEFDSQLKYVPESEKFIIEVNSKHPVNRQRFSIAHEIAHFVKHSNLVKERLFIDRSKLFSLADQKIEDEANRLAAEILMPKDMVLASIRKAGLDKKSFVNMESLKTLADKFKVSVMVALLRLKELGYRVEYVSLA